MRLSKGFFGGIPSHITTLRDAVAEYGYPVLKPFQQQEH